MDGVFLGLSLACLFGAPFVLFAAICILGAALTDSGDSDAGA